MEELEFTPEELTIYEDMQKEDWWIETNKILEEMMDEVHEKITNNCESK